MQSDKKNITTLVALLRNHGIENAVVCPGSRNAPIVRSMCHAGINCVAVTDERSASFYALGMSQALGSPVAVCVTSGSALLNLSPGLVEAQYRNLPIIAISADRPTDMIGQMQGQTIEQPGALSGIVKRTVNLPEPCDASSQAYCNRLVNEALIAAIAFPSGPVHINVPISAPLFGESVRRLDPQRYVRAYTHDGSLPADGITAIMSNIYRAARPMIVVGQCQQAEAVDESISRISAHIPVLCEPLSSGTGASAFETALHAVCGEDAYMPDYVVYVGGNIVSNKLREYLRSCQDAQTCIVAPDAQVHDPFGTLSMLVEGDACSALSAIVRCMDAAKLNGEVQAFCKRWQKALRRAREKSEAIVPAYSQTYLVKTLEECIGSGAGYKVHYANSSAVRLANIYARHYVYVNRGVNGIEGTLSAACGHSLVTTETVVCVIGDLSFFYDSNALWQGSLRGNLRILLMNNQRGSIFKNVSGMPDDDLTDHYVMGSHTAQAETLCRAYGIDYLRINDAQSAQANIRELCNLTPRSRPLLVEAITDASVDASTYKRLITL